MVDVCPTTAAAGDIAPLAVGVFDEGHPVGRVGVGLDKGKLPVLQRLLQHDTVTAVTLAKCVIEFSRWS
jgi:hypothetical protein